MSLPNVVIITRTKDRTFLLKRAVASILHQTYDDFQIVIVNDGGDPEPINQLVNQQTKEAQQKIKVVHNQSPTGRPAAINAGIKNSDSKYLTLLDDDDTWNKDFLKETVGFLESNPGYKGVVTACELVLESYDGGRPKIVSRQRLTPFRKDFNLFYIAGANQFTVNSFVYERSVYKKVGYYNEDLPVVEDWDFNQRFIASYDIGFIDKVLASYHKREADLSSLDNTADSTHIDLTKQLLNKALRDDIATGKVPVGLVQNLSHANDALTSLLHKQSAELETLRARLEDNIYYAKNVWERMALAEERLERIDASIHHSLEYRARRFIKNKSRRSNKK